MRPKVVPYWSKVKMPLIWPKSKIGALNRSGNPPEGRWTTILKDIKESGQLFDEKR